MEKSVVDRKTLAGILGVHPKSITRLVSKGIIPITTGSTRLKNLFDVEECKEKYAEYTKETNIKYFGGGKSKWSD